MTVLETDRLTLRRLALNDAEFILRLLNQRSFLRHIGDKGVRNVADARDYLQNGPLDSYRRFGFGLYLAALHESNTPRGGTSLPGGTPIGICGLVKREALEDVDLGFAFMPEHCGRGYAGESAAAVLGYGLGTLGLSRIVAITAPDNHASIAVLEKVGLRFERMVKLPDRDIELKLYGPSMLAPR